MPFVPIKGKLPDMMGASGKNPYGATNYNITYQCLDRNDPRVRNDRIESATSHHTPGSSGSLARHVARRRDQSAVRAQKG